MGTTIVHTLPELAPRGFNDTLAQGICEKCLHPMHAHVDHQDTICQFLTYTFHDCADSYCALSWSQGSVKNDWPNLSVSYRYKQYTGIFLLVITEIPAFLAPRTELVDELIARLQYYHIIRVRGTPASGKTTLMRLVANKLFETHGKTAPIHVLTGWKYDQPCSNWKKISREDDRCSRQVVACLFRLFAYKRGANDILG